MADSSSSNSARDLIIIVVVVAVAIYGAREWQRRHGAFPLSRASATPAAAGFLRELQGADMKAALSPSAAKSAVPKGAAATAPKAHRDNDRLNSSDRAELHDLLEQVVK